MSKKKVIRRFEELGFAVELLSGGHYRLTKDGVSVSTSQSPSCHRAYKNVLSEWRHAYHRKHGVLPPRPKGKIT